MNPRLLVPALGAGALKAQQLLVLLCLASVTSGAERDYLIASFGILASFAIVADAGGSQFLLTRTRDALSVAVYRRALVCQTALGSCGAAAAVGFSVVVLASSDTQPQAVITILALAVSQAADSAARAAKAPLLVIGCDAKYGALDLGVTIVKLPVILVSVWLASVEFLWILPAVSAIGAGVAVALSLGKAIDRGAVASAPPYVRIVEFGLGGALSALYSQAPMIVGASVLTTSAAATLAVVTRLIQALEFVPATFANQLLPRLTSGAVAIRRAWFALLSLGFGLGVCGVLALPALVYLFPPLAGSMLLMSMFGVAFVAKSGNYLLVSALLARALVRSRIIMSVVVGLVAWPICYAAAERGGLQGLALSAVAIELVVCAGCLVILRRPSKMTDVSGLQPDA